MKNKFIYLIIIILMSINVNSQTIKIYDAEFINKKSFQLMKTTVYDVSGKETSGYFYQATDSTLFISNKSKDSVYVFHTEDIYRLKFDPAPGYKGLVLGTFIGMQIINVGVGVTLTSDYFPENLIIGQAIVLPVTAGAAVLFSRNKFDYLIDSDTSQYQIVVPYLSKKSPTNANNLNPIEIERKSKNPIALEQIKKPSNFFHPLSYSIFDISLNILYYVNSMENQIIEFSKQADFTEIYKADNLPFSAVFTFGINILPKLNFSYSAFTKSSAKIQTIYKGNNLLISNAIINSYFNYNAKQLTIKYIINPVPRILSHKFEYSVALSYINYKGYFNIDFYLKNYSSINYRISPSNDSYNDFKLKGFSFSGNVDYYLTKNISVNFGISTNILKKYNYEKQLYIFEDNSFVEFKPYEFNLNSVLIGLGLKLHL